MKQYYAYLHAKPDAENIFDIFYVGKGYGKRCYNLSRRNPYYSNIVNKYGKPLVSKIECSSESIAFELEKGLIKCLRNMGVKLANLTNGGEGTAGLVQTDEHRMKIGNGNKGKIRTEETRNKLSVSHIGKIPANKGIPSPLRGSKLSEETKKKLSIQKLENNPMRGNTHSDSAKSAISKFTSSTKWYNDGKTNRRLTQNEIQFHIDLGWKSGRVSSKRTCGVKNERK